MIYLIRAGDNGPVKIGYVQDPGSLDDRLDRLQIGNAEELYVAAIAPGERDQERALHERFADGRVRGEWFALDTPGLREFIFEAGNLEALALWNEGPWKGML